jgi:hypothetical protein
MIKNFIKTAFLTLSAAFFVFSSLGGIVNAQTTEAPAVPGNFGLEETVNNNPVNKDAFLKPENNTPAQLAGRIIGVILSFVGVIFFALIVYSGVKWMTSQGNDSVIDSAKQTIVSATIGLIVTLSAYALTSFIGQQLTNTN